MRGARAPQRLLESLDSKAESLRELVADARPLLDEARLGELEKLSETVGERVRRGAEHTVVGFFGATGSGKSSLMNAIAGAQIAQVAHRRPTTSAPLAAIVDDEAPGMMAAAHDLLDWLDISQRHVIGRDAGGRGVIYVDLPDFDSVERANREVAARLAERVDVLVWVSDPQKYADAVLHTEFIARYASHALVSLAVVNQVDRLSRDDVKQVVQSLEGLLRADGLDSVGTYALSAHTGEGIDELRSAIAKVADRKSAAMQRLHADMREHAVRTAPALGAQLGAQGFTIPDLARELPQRGVDALEDAMAKAAQTGAIAGAVGQSYRLRASLATGWPLTRWLGKFKADPLARMRIGRGAASHRRDDTHEEFIARSSLSVDAPQAVAGMNRGFDAFIDEVVGNAPQPWPHHVRAVLEPDRERLADTLDYALTHTDINARERSWWWTPVNVAQWLALVAAMVGLGWLLGLSALAFFQIPAPPIPAIEGLWIPVPIPTALIMFGLLLGIVMAIMAKALAIMGGRRRAKRAQARLRASIREQVLLGPGERATGEIERAARLEHALTRLEARA